MAAKKKEPPKDPEEDKEEPKKSMRDVVEEVHKESKEKEEPKEEVDEPDEDVKDDEPEVDLKEVLEEDRKKQKEKLRADILETMGFDKDTQAAAKEEGYKTPWETRGEDKPKNWQEAVEAGADLADFRKRQADIETKKEKEKTDAAQSERDKQQNVEWDHELVLLENRGSIPKISSELQQKMKKGETLTEEEKQADPGLQARATLFGKMMELHRGGTDTTTSLRLISHEYFEGGVNKPPAGADAPVSGGSKSVAQPSDDYSYDDIHKKSMEDLMREGLDS